MLPSVIKGARIWAFDYNSNYSRDAQTVQVDGLAMTLLTCITDRRDDFDSRKIVFIGSCFGGIVVAEVRNVYNELTAAISMLTSIKPGTCNGIPWVRTQTGCV